LSNDISPETAVVCGVTGESQESEQRSPFSTRTFHRNF